MMKGAQCRAARALVGISTEKLAKLSGVDVAVIQAFELRICQPSSEAVHKLERALEYAGADFLPESGGLGVGVRLKCDGATTGHTGKRGRHRPPRPDYMALTGNCRTAAAPFQPKPASLCSTK